MYSVAKRLLEITWSTYPLIFKFVSRACIKISLPSTIFCKYEPKKGTLQCWKEVKKILSLQNAFISDYS